MSLSTGNKKATVPTCIIHESGAGMAKRHVARYFDKVKKPEGNEAKEFLHHFITPCLHHYYLSLNNACSGTVIPNRRKPSGFTLVEILISLTLLTVVLGAVYSSFFSVQRVLERFDRVSLKYQEARTALDVMRREIEGAYLNTRAEENENLRTVFIIKDRDILDKNTSSLEWTAFTFRGSGLSAISYYVEEKEGRLNLLKKETPVGIQSKDYAMETVEDIEGFTVETLINDQWVRTWDTANIRRLPETIRVSIEFDDNGNKVKLVEYAKPKIGRNL